MPSSQRRTSVRVKKEMLEDLEPKPEKVRSGSTKELPISKVITDTLTDRISATASYAVSGSMLRTVGRDYAITPVEAYNIFYPVVRIITHYLPGTVIKTSLPQDVADNAEKILITTLEYVTRVSSGWIKSRFDRQMERAGLREPARPPRNIPVQTPIMTVEDGENTEYSDIAHPVASNGQVKPGLTHMDFEELIADGTIIGDTGQNIA